jgi:RHS repeat-associated protein
LARFGVSFLTLARYRYNFSGQRTQKTTPLDRTLYHYDLQGHLIAETTATGQTLKAYVWADHTPLAQIEANGSPVYLHTDHLDTPRLATNPSGAIIWRWNSDAFGAIPPDSDPDGDGTRTTLNLRFAGQYFDAETGFFYNWNRYYDPKLGRYLNPDPVGLDAGLNLYTYVSNNPLRWVDPTGLMEEAPGAPQQSPYTGPPDEPLEPVSPEQWLPPVRTLSGAMILATSMKKAIESAANICKNIRCKIELHGPHHTFGWPFNKRMNHVQLTCWIKGQKGSTFIIRIPYLTPNASGGGGP